MGEVGGRVRLDPHGRSAGPVFSFRGSSSNPRLRAFAPLCPQSWASTTLAFIKEVDTLNTCRAEVNTASASQAKQRRGEVGPVFPTSRRMHPRPRHRGGSQLAMPAGFCSCRASHYGHARYRACQCQCRISSFTCFWEVIPLPNSVSGNPYSSEPSRVTFRAWSMTLVSRILETRCPFASFLHATLRLSEGPVAPAHALFHVPLIAGAFESVRPNVSSRTRDRVAIRRVVDVVVAALNYLHNGRAPPPPPAAEAPERCPIPCIAAYRSACKVMRCGRSFRMKPGRNAWTRPLGP